MCYTIEINLTREQLEKRFGSRFKDRDGFNPKKRLSAFAFPEVPIICSSDPDEIKLYQWGLIPFWIKNEKDALSFRSKTCNAVSETIEQKPSYRSLYRKKHCLVLMNGYYEWHHRDKIKQPYLIRLKNDKPFALAGLYDNWTNKETGVIYNTFSVLTTNANPLIATIHNTKKRMPVILNPDNEMEWLNTKLPADSFKEIFQALDQHLMHAEEVDKALFSRKAI